MTLRHNLDLCENMTFEALVAQSIELLVFARSAASTPGRGETYITAAQVLSIIHLVARPRSSELQSEDPPGLTLNQSAAIPGDSTAMDSTPIDGRTLMEQGPKQAPESKGRNV